MNTNHQSYLIDINLEMYFDEEFLEWDKINKGMLDLNKRTYQEKFKEFTEELLGIILIKDIIFEMIRGEVIREIIEKVDEEILFLLNKVKYRIER